MLHAKSISLHVRESFQEWIFVKICKQVSITPVFAEFLKNKKTHFMK